MDEDDEILRNRQTCAALSAQIIAKQAQIDSASADRKDTLLRERRRLEEARRDARRQRAKLMGYELEQG